MRVSKEVGEKIITLEEKQMSHTLSEFYRCVAEEAGHEETEDTVYDCTKILVAPNVQDAIIQAYQERWPEVPIDAIIIRLAISGPKVCGSLHCGQVVILDGFISMK